MSRLQKIGMLAAPVLVLGIAWGQDSSSPGSATPDASQQQSQPVPAYGQENAPAPITENPPITGLDQPGLEPHAAPLSYLQPGATVSESADSNIGNGLGGQTFNSVSLALGSLTLERLWSHYDLALDYIGGVGYYDVAGLGLKSIQQMDIDQKISWKRGQLSVRDSFSYLPEGNFGAAYGSTGSEGIQSLGSTSFGSFWSGSALGTLGEVPRILNVSLADVTENLTPKSAVTAVGGYAFTHFYGSDAVTGGPFLDSSQTSTMVGYDRILTSKTQVALLYGYQVFNFSVLGTSFHSNVIQLMYGHRITGRMSFVAGAGPQITHVNLYGILNEQRLGVAGQAQLRYQFPKTSLALSYERYLTSGSGLFLGAQSDIVRASVNRPLSRVWNIFADGGYARNSRVQPPTTAELANCGGSGQPLCPGVDAGVFKATFAGLGVHRNIGRDFHAYASYQFNQLWFDHTYCGTLLDCNRIGNRQVITLGLDWKPRPIRLD